LILGIVWSRRSSKRPLRLSRDFFSRRPELKKAKACIFETLCLVRNAAFHHGKKDAESNHACVYTAF
jgi:hypothetical protein